MQLSYFTHQKTSTEGFINCSRTPAFHQRLPNIFFETTSVSTWYRVDHAKKMRRWPMTLRAIMPKLLMENLRDLENWQFTKCKQVLQNKPLLLKMMFSLITMEVGINVEGCKSCKINWPFSVNFWARMKFYISKWPWEKSSSGSVRILESFVMKSINVEGDFFVEGGIFQNR